eukprot:scaffold303908_cov28-Tisochrysis_lutea.AAC.1
MALAMTMYNIGCLWSPAGVYDLRLRLVKCGLYDLLLRPRLVVLFDGPPAGGGGEHWSPGSGGHEAPPACKNPL